MATRKILVAGTGSNAGKTTVTIGLMAAYKDLGYRVQGFKCGPDYIDPTYQTIATGREARNLDSWMCQEDGMVNEIFSRGCEDADIAIIEGVMGLFDGKEPLSDTGSSAEIANITNTPVLLVIDGSGVARSAAATVKGFQTLSPHIKVGAVVVNYVGSEGHFQLIKKAVESECHIPVIGYLEKDERLVFPERYLGLLPTLQHEKADDTFDVLSESIQACFDLETLYHVMGEEPTRPDSDTLFGIRKKQPKVRMAIAKDEAFHFYYKENLELLEQLGAELVYFSPLHGETLPRDVHGLYLGGGFPEQFAHKLSEHEEVKASIYDSIAGGMPTLAEGGGFMYLCSFVQDFTGQEHPMVGMIPGVTKMQSRLAGFGYKTAVGNEDENHFLIEPGEVARGHEFHYSSFEPATVLPFAYTTNGMRGEQQNGIIKHNLIASYIHLHFGSNLNIAENWIKKCMTYQSENS